MHQFLRRVHLFSAMALLVFVLMYFVTGLPLTHENWFAKTAPKKSTRTEWVTFIGEPGSAAFAEYLEERFELKGTREKPKHLPDGSWKFAWHRPGTGFEAVVTPDLKEAAITEIKYPPRNIFVGLHRIHGYGHGPLYDLWAVMLDLASSATILFALTGIYLWYNSTKKRTAGWVCLGLGCGFTVLTILHFMFQR